MAKQLSEQELRPPGPKVSGKSLLGGKFSKHLKGSHLQSEADVQLCPQVKVKLTKLYLIRYPLPRQGALADCFPLSGWAPRY